MPRINWIISFKDLLAIGAILVALGGLFANTSAGFSSLTKQIDALGGIVSAIQQKIDRDHEEMVRHGMRIDALEKDQVRQDRDISGKH